MLSMINPLIKMALTGCRPLEWMPIFIARFSLGLFFAVSGFNKLFVAEKHEDLIALMTNIGLPFPEFTALFLGGIEFFGGLCLMLGLLSTFFSIALTIAMFVAIVTVELDTIPKGLGSLDWMGWFLYLPQVMYVILFGWLMTTGPGRLSVDYLLAKALRVDDD
jgi:putative oxidoreductase